jgi:hypothetical protein
VKKTKVGEMNARELAETLRSKLAPCHPKVFKKPVFVFVRTEMLPNRNSPRSKKKICYVSHNKTFRECPYVAWVPPDDEKVEETAAKLALALAIQHGLVRNVQGLNNINNLLTSSGEK